MDTIGLPVRPRARQQFDGIEPYADEQIGLREDRLLDGGVREHAGEVWILVWHHALCLVGDHRGNVMRRAERADGGDGVWRARAQADEQEWTARES